MPPATPEAGDLPWDGEPAIPEPEGGVAAYRPRVPAVLAALALLLTLGLGYVASRHKASQDAILEEQRQLLELKTSLSRVERQVLLARNDESTLLLKGGAGPIDGLRKCMHDVDQAWRELEGNPRSKEVVGDLAVVQETIGRYRSAVDTSVRILKRLGRAGEPGLLDELQVAEAALDSLFGRLGVSEPSLRFANLRLRQRDFSNSLNIEHAEALLRDTEALAEDISARAQSALTPQLLDVIQDYRSDVFQAMSGVLELELATSQSSLRFDRVSPAIRDIESHLDALLQAAARDLQSRRRASLTQTVLMIAAVFVIALLLMFFETKRAMAWLALESRLQQAQKLESLGVLTGGIAHDFNNLLTGVLGHAQLALNKLPPGSGIRRHVQSIKTAARRAAELTQQMLAYAGEARFVFEACDLGDLVEEMTRLLETAVSKKVRLHHHRASERTVVEADTTQIRQVIMNLITNASDALGESEGTVSIQTGLIELADTDLPQSAVGYRLTPGRFVFLEIVDDGCGMDEETRSRIFEPFFSTKAKGRGLGMAAVLGIVKAHHGAIQVDSEPRRGSTFRVFLPASNRRVATAPGRASHVTRREGLGTVLVVDDDEMVRVVSRACLKELGFEALIAEDGLSAVRLFDQHNDEIQIVLLDMSMPGLDGEETLHELRRIRPGVKVILCSGHPEEKIISRVQGLAGFLEKPYGPDQLAEKVFEALGLRLDSELREQDEPARGVPEKVV